MFRKRIRKSLTFFHVSPDIHQSLLHLLIFRRFRKHTKRFDNRNACAGDTGKLSTEYRQVSRRRLPSDIDADILRQCILFRHIQHNQTLCFQFPEHLLFAVGLLAALYLFSAFINGYESPSRHERTSVVFCDLFHKHFHKY